MLVKSLTERKTMSSPSRRLITSLALIASAALTLTACAAPGTSESGSTAADSDAYPVTIEHVFGETEITEKPERIVTIGWYSQDVAAALGVVPVGVEDFSWGNVDTYLPWFVDKVDELGGELPEILKLNDSYDYDYEQILALDPDVILALHTGIDETTYDRLSEIAPTVAYADKVWSSDRDELTLNIGRVLGKEEEAQALLDQSDEAIAAAADAHPEFAGVVFTYGWYLAEGETSVDLYLQRDPRVTLTEELGFVSSPQVVASADTTEDFTFALSLEEIGDVESEFHIGWGNSAEDVARTVENPLLSRWAPIASGSYYFFDDDFALAWATTAPSVLSIPATVGEIADELASGLKTP